MLYREIMAVCSDSHTLMSRQHWWIDTELCVSTVCWCALWCAALSFVFLQCAVVHCGVLH